MPSVILQTLPLGFPWPTLDPFLFCVHHFDRYPASNGRLGPNASLAGRDRGSDFAGKDGWNMYHGDEIPGFPQHPHRGFETVTLVRQGLVDHSDSLGAQARFGRGDAQWLTAGKGIVHSEMFPLLRQDAPNTLELFQIWLNLPGREKMCEPHFSMLWNEAIPRLRHTDASGRHTDVTVVAGKLGSAEPPSPPPHSWARNPENQVAIWALRLDPDAHYVLPPAQAGINRMLYFFAGESASVAGESFKPGVALRLRPESEIELRSGPVESEFLLLQGKPIAETVAQYGPFVMNSRSEIEKAFADYQRTHFGGWPWPSDEPTHGFAPSRFAVHVDGRKEMPENP